MFSNPRHQGIAALLVATSGWGGMFLVSHGALHRIDPYWFTLIRYSVAAAIFALLLAPRGLAPWRKLKAHAAALAGRGVLGFGVFSVLLLTGLAHSVPSHGAVIMAEVPMTTQLVRWILDGIRPARSTVLTALLALAGVAIVSGVVFQSAPAASGATLFGDALTLAGTLGWIAYTRGATYLPAFDALEYTALTVLASWPLLAAGAIGASLAGWAAMPDAAAIASSWHALLYVGVISSAVAVLAFNHGLRTLGPVTATAFLNFVPVSTLLMASMLGKIPSAHELVGTAMVVAALLIHTRASRPEPTSAQPAKIAPSTTKPCGAAV